MNELTNINNRLSSIDISKLVEYTRKIQDIGAGLNPALAPMYLRDFILAYDVASTYLASAIRADMQADSLLKQAESIAFLDRAGDYLSEKGVRDSAEARKQYVPIDPDVMSAKDMRAKTTAMVSLMKNKVHEYRFAMEAVKKIGYTSEYQSQYEGM